MAASSYISEVSVVLISGISAYFLPLGSVEPKSFKTKLLKKVVPVLLLTISLMTWAYTGRDPLQTFTCFVFQGAPQCRLAPTRQEETAPTPTIVTLPPGPKSTPLSAPNPTGDMLGNEESQRDFFKRNLKRLQEDGEPVLEQFVANHNDHNENYVSEVNKWVEETSQWICFNMGKTATVHFLDPNPVPVSDILVSGLSQTKAWLLFRRWRENLSTLIDKDDWDPIRKPEQTERACSWHEHNALAIALSKLGH